MRKKEEEVIIYQTYISIQETCTHGGPSAVRKKEIHTYRISVHGVGSQR